jgi:indolepyruvate ferredoxin oxidoreductase
VALDAITADRQAEPRAATLAELIDRRAEFLAAYQNEAYALRYRQAVERVQADEARELPGHTELTEAAARSLFKLMAYKDEYEVARLDTDGSFEKQLGAEFASWGKLEFHLAPPVLGDRDTAGRLRKRRYGPWMMPAFRVLAKLRWLRGTPLDPFGWMAERRTERRLIGEFDELLGEIAHVLTAGNHPIAVELAGLPLTIRGFGHVKDANLQKAKARESELLSQLRDDRALQQAAE